MTYLDRHRTSIKGLRKQNIPFRNHPTSGQINYFSSDLFFVIKKRSCRSKMNEQQNARVIPPNADSSLAESNREGMCGICGIIMFALCSFKY